MTPESLARLHGACFTAPRPWSAAEFATLLAGPGIILASSAAGFALGRTTVDEAELLTLAVSPAQRRRGHGRTLLGEFERAACQAGARRVFLEVSIDNIGARSLYRSAGYARAGLRKGYLRAPDGAAIDALIKVKTLVREPSPGRRSHPGKIPVQGDESTKSY